MLSPTNALMVVCRHLRHVLLPSLAGLLAFIGTVGSAEQSAARTALERTQTNHPCHLVVHEQGKLVPVQVSSIQ